MAIERRTIIICILGLSLCMSACGPGELLGPTYTPTPTITFTPTLTTTPTPTSTPTPTLTPTPLPTMTPSLIPQAGQAIGGGKFDGRWTASFTFQINTRLQEVNHPWYIFFFDLHQQGSNVTGTIASLDNSVTGTLQSIVDKAGVFHGTMRLSWDTHDWESLSMRIFPAGTYGVGTAIFPAALNEWHFYTVELVPATN